MEIKYIKRALKHLNGKVYYKKSYSQCGEDLIINHLVKYLDINKPTYIDIGANHPKKLNNTYFFYKNGSVGVLVEPNKQLCKLISRTRKRDTVINAGIGISKENTAKYYVMSCDTLSTFCKEEAERIEKMGSIKICNTEDVKMYGINDILEKYFNGAPDIFSIDIEGLDLEVLKTLDFSKYRPKIFCIETLEYTQDRSAKKDNELIDFMVLNGYSIYADTYINTILYDSNLIK